MLSELYKHLVEDPWRASQGFSEEMTQANTLLMKADTDAERAGILNAWMEKYQPCLFGRIAAKKNLITYCFLTDVDLTGSDSAVRDKVQLARTQWTRLAYEGRRSAFVLVAISTSLINALPDANLLAFAKHLASLYLLQEVRADDICLDEVFLEMPGPTRATWRWNVGVNFFGAGGDKRWWQDHRIPGGVGFSANSVGHLVKSGQIAESVNELERVLGVQSGDLVTTKITSLPTALEWAMRTIHNASEGPSGKATELLPLDASQTGAPACPVTLPKFLQDRDYCEYRGYYHTDITVPSEYFDGAVNRPDAQQAKALDFTYLFDERTINPDFTTTATGRRVRGLTNTETPRAVKSTRSVATSGPVAAYPRLEAALTLES